MAGLCGRRRDDSLDHDPAGSPEFTGTNPQGLLRKIDVRLIHVEVEDWLSSSDASRSAGWFSECSPHSFLESVGACSGDHTILSENDMRVRSEADYVACLAERVEENLVRGNAGCLKRVVANLDWGLHDQANPVVVSRLGVTHGELRDSRCW